MAATVETVTVDLDVTVETLQTAVRTNDEAAILRYGLTHHQRLGVKYLEDTRRRVPRGVIATFERFLHKWLVADGCVRTVCGSYRRGKPDSGDVDVHELRNGLAQLGLSTSTRQAAKILAKYDEDDSMRVELPEFRQIVADLRAFQQA